MDKGAEKQRVCIRNKKVSRSLHRAGWRRGHFLDWHSGGVQFESRTGIPASLTQVFVIFLRSSRNMRGTLPWLGHEHFLPNPLQVIIYIRSFDAIYEEESVYRSQMDIKLRTCDIRTWKKHLFLDIFSTNIDTLVPSLSQCVETRSIQVFWLLFQPLPHLAGNHLRLWNGLGRISRPSCEPHYARSTFKCTQETFLYE
jgi:hypothetical protein